MKIKNRNGGQYTYLEITNAGITIYSYDNYGEKINFEYVDNFKIVVYVIEQAYKGNKYSKLQNLHIKFSISGKDYVFVTKGSWKILYNILNYKNRFSDFELRVNGAKDGIDIPIKIYSKFGIKLFVKDSDSLFYLLSMAAVFTVIPFYHYYEVHGTNFSMAEFDLYFTLIFLTISAILTLPIIYHEYLKWKIRRIIGL